MNAATALAAFAGDAERFLSLLGGQFTFQTFGESSRKDTSLRHILHGTLAEHAATLVGLNARGAGVFVMVNTGNGKGRCNANVQHIRAYFADLDGAPLEPIRSAPLAPHIVIESSPGRWHAYWLVNDAPLATFKCVQVAIAKRFASDVSVNDLCRVMRLPGFDHRKGQPFRTRIIDVRDVSHYTHAQFVEAFAIDLRAETGHATVTPPATATHRKRTLPDVIPTGERNATLFSLACGLVRQGFDAPAVNDRLQRINTERCAPPLGADEVDTIAARAVAYGSDGFATLPHRLLDSPEWKALPPAAHDVILLAFRRFDGFNNGNIALTFADFAGRDGFAKPDTFREHRKAAVHSGILLQTRLPRNTQRGRKPGLYAIAERWIAVDSARPNKRVLRQTQKGNTYIDKQSFGDVASAIENARIKPKRNAA